MKPFFSRWIDELQALAIIFAAPFFLFPRIGFTWIYLAFPCLWIIRWRLRGRFFENTVIDWAIGLLLIEVVATCLIVPNIRFSLSKIVGTVFGILIFYCLVNLLRTEQRICWGVWGFATLGLGFAILGIVGMNWNSAATEKFSSRLISQIGRLIPTQNWRLPGAEEGFNPNAVAGTLLLFSPLLLVLLINDLKKTRRSRSSTKGLLRLVLISIGVIMVGIELALTQSVGSWVALFVSVWFLLLSRKWKTWCMVGVVAMVMILIFVTPQLFSKKEESQSIYNIIKAKIEVRYPIYQAGFDAIKKNPVFGVGMNRLRLDPNVGYENSHAHNQLLQTGAELGIPGLAAYLAILFGVGWMSREVLKKTNKDWMKVAVRGLAGGQLAYFMFGVGDAIPLGAKTGVVFWLSLALLTAIYNNVLTEHWKRRESFEMEARHI
jgi:hypothetical protein